MNHAPESTRTLPTGEALLHNPTLNKGTAFTQAERDALGLNGLLPPHISTMQEQVTRVLQNVRRKPTDIEKYIYMVSLQDRNETLFHRVVIDNIEEFMPILYTPTVGQACREYGHIFRRARGLFISLKDQGRVRDVLANWHNDDVRVVVVTDGERILGLGDLGASGMGIPVGKLTLYAACAGVHPSQCLPVTLDVGTDTEALREDPLYLGIKRRRERGQAYFALVDEFVKAVQAMYPQALIQFEDFGNRNAFRFLEQYRSTVCMFNDDIQGTAAVTLAGLYSAARITGTELRDQKILYLGAGEAGLGIGELVVSAMKAEGLTEANARRQNWFVDSRGLVVHGRDHLNVHKMAFAHDYDPVPDLLSAIEVLRPTAIIGASGQGGGFTPQIINAMAKINKRPLILALSNPTSSSECTAEDAYRYSEGSAIFASGSPFPSVTLDDEVFVPGQANNAYVFPGVGLGVVVSGAQIITDEMFFTAAKILAGLVGESDLALGRLYPPLTDIRRVSVKIATAVAEIAYEKDLATQPRPDNIEAAVAAAVYEPEYADYA